MDDKNFTKLWDTLYILMRCFNVEMGHPACQSLVSFFKSLEFIIPYANLRYLLSEFMRTNPLDNYMCKCTKHVRWVVALNNYICQYLKKNPDNFESVCKKYDPSKIDIKTWGNSVWYFIHFTALHLGQNETNINGKPFVRETKLTPTVAYSYKQMMYALSFILPCKKCREHLRTHLSEFPIDNYLTTNEKLFEWTVILHNIVNKSLGKKEISLENARKLYV